MTRVRKEDWSEKLHAAVETAKLLPFKYGLHDCCTWAAYCVDAMTGSNVLKEMQERDGYSDEAGAYRRISDAGGLQPLLMKYLGAPLESAAYAAPGDVVIADADGRMMVGVVLGSQVVTVADQGILALPYHTIRHAWRV